MAGTIRQRYGTSTPAFPTALLRYAKRQRTTARRPVSGCRPGAVTANPKQQRVAAARAAGYEIVDNGFALSGPKYYELFRDTCMTMICVLRRESVQVRRHRQRQSRLPRQRTSTATLDAAINLIGELRALKPDLYINLTTGTYPSPFWLRYADSIWRGGEDHDFLGVGPWRERWITYRDANTYEHVVLGGPLFPLNSLMLHGIIYARHAQNLDTDPQGDFKNEVRDYFGTGTQLQEMYITPSLLSPADWDTLAEAANWSRANADILVDTHWVGGDPAQLEVYGWASWRPEKAILVLRNPSDQPQSLTVDLAKTFELPASAPASYRLHSPWKEDAKLARVTLDAGRPHSFLLRPFEVMVLEGAPESSR